MWVKYKDKVDGTWSASDILVVKSVKPVAAEGCLET
jgi:hypothetical protein